MKKILVGDDAELNPALQRTYLTRSGIDVWTANIRNEALEREYLGEPSGERASTDAGARWRLPCPVCRGRMMRLIDGLLAMIRRTRVSRAARPLRSGRTGGRAVLRAAGVVQ